MTIKNITKARVKASNAVHDPLKFYYIRAEVGEGYPSYDFVLKYKTLKQAEKEAKKILMQDYPDTFVGKYADRFSCYEVTADQLIKIMTLN